MRLIDANALFKKLNDEWHESVVYSATTMTDYSESTIA